MRDGKGQGNPEARQALQGALQFLVFGLGILAFLIAIDRPEWFHIQPPSGIAAAPTHAVDSDVAAK